MRGTIIMKTLMIILMMFLMAGPAFAQEGFSETPSLSKIVFYVAWYDVGKSALDGLKGIVSVTNGFRMLREVNRVTYDANLITPDEMISALKAAGTYQGLAVPPNKK